MKALIIKNVEEGDIVDLFDWRNHPDIKKNFFNSNPVSWQEHEKWFKTKLQDTGSAIYIAYCEKTKVGSVRFEDKGNVITVSVMLNPDFIGKGFGAEVIKKGTENYIAEKQPNKPIIAEIKNDNTPSLKAFQKAGYKERNITLFFEMDKQIENESKGFITE